MSAEADGLRSVPWRLSYRTSTLRPDGRPVDILHDFYIPALQRSIRYDRVAGYFRSTSLAAASQGFSALVGRQGQVRLIVGADLDPDDVRAILHGGEERLAARLNAELDGAATWPEGVRHGVELLAWMVAQGSLEVRVAFRVHLATGEPLAVDSLQDGYVHMKWAVFTDAQGNRLYAAGSLNESRTALSLNAENLDVHCDWQGERDRQRVEEAAQEFEVLWQNQHPALRVLTLPEAVRQRLIDLAAGVTHPTEIDGSSAAPRPVSPPSALERLRFALLRDGSKLPGGRYVGMETAPITPWPHQTVVARRLIATWPYSYLLCDEVGMIVGTQQMSLLPVTPEEFSELANETLGAETLERRAMERARSAQQRTASMEMSPQELYQIYTRLSEGARQIRVPVDLAAIWRTLCRSRYLRELGCRFHAEGDEPFMTVSNIPGVMDGTAITTSRPLFDAGSPAFEGRLHFATYDDAVFEAILQQIEEFPLPDGIRRLEVKVSGIQAPTVGYAVAEQGVDGLPHCRLVTSWDDVATLHLDPSGNLSEPELQPLRQRLRDMAQQEFAMVQAVPRIEALNERAGRAQLQLDYLVG